MKTPCYIKNTHLANPWLFFLFTSIWSWSFFGITYSLGLNGERSALGTSLVFLALSGPAIMAIIFTYLALNPQGRSDYWIRIIDYRRIPIKWYAIILLLAPTINLVAALLSGYCHSASFFSNRLPHLFLLILVVPIAPLLEELGWRGYVLDRLQEKYTALVSSLILGVVWFFWHFPAFFLPGSVFSAMPIGSPAFWLYTVTLIVLSIFFTWIYNNTNRSTLQLYYCTYLSNLVQTQDLCP